MDNKLVRVASKSLEVNSLTDLVRVRTNENSVLCIDVSLSMKDHMRNGKMRIDGLREVVTQIQSKKPTQMIAFGLNPSLHPTDPEAAFRGEFSPGGKSTDFVTEVPDAQGGTPMHEAIDLARTSGFGRCVVISDGSPNDRSLAMDAARQFGGRVDVIYVGDPGDAGSFFLDELAKATGGQRLEGDLSEVKEISGAIVALLGGEVLEEVDEDDDEDDDEDGDEDDDDDDEDEDGE